MNAPLPSDIAQHLADAAAEFRAAMAGAPHWWHDGWTADSMQAAADEYQRDAIAGSQSPDEQGYSVEETK